MSRKREAIFMGIGILAGLALSGPAVQASTALTAKPSSQPIYVDGLRVSMTAYSIGGNNYVKLRDVGRAVDFGVEYDAATNSVHINPAAPYTEEVKPPAPTAPSPAPAGTYSISADHWSREDFSRQANPAVFTGVYDRALYNTIRQALVDGGAGSAPAYTMVAQGADYSAVKNLIGRLDNTKWFGHYVPDNFTEYWKYPNYFAVDSQIPEQFQAPLAYIQPTIAQVNRLGSDREKVTYLNDYLCTLLAYQIGEAAGVPSIFSAHGGELKAACGSYAIAFKFLCGAADIPCFTVSTAEHAWNMVYADGQWLHVDVSANDLRRCHSVLLTETYPGQTDIAPEATAFLKELLVPGSTK